jgi:hypothetical protein
MTVYSNNDEAYFSMDSLIAPTTDCETGGQALWNAPNRATTAVVVQALLSEC